MSSELIHQILARPLPTFLSDPYHGHYNGLLNALFPELSFSRNMDWDMDAMTVIFGNGPLSSMKPVFIFLILPASQYHNITTACTNADSAMRKLLTDANNAPIPIIHGVCVSGTRIAFYQYNREQDLILPLATQVNVDFDLVDDDGGVAHLLEVAENIKNMCRELGGNDDLNVVNL
jgi:hypothetical protein